MRLNEFTDKLIEEQLDEAGMVFARSKGKSDLEQEDE